MNGLLLRATAGTRDPMGLAAPVGRSAIGTALSFLDLEQKHRKALHIWPSGSQTRRGRTALGGWGEPSLCLF